MKKLILFASLFAIAQTVTGKTTSTLSFKVDSSWIGIGGELHTGMIYTNSPNNTCSFTVSVQKGTDTATVYVFSNLGGNGTVNFTVPCDTTAGSWVITGFGNDWINGDTTQFGQFNVHSDTATVPAISTDIASVITESRILVYPSPASTLITIRPLDKKSDITIWDVSGHLLMTIHNHSDEEVQINLSDLPSGNYFAKNGQWHESFIKL